MNDERLTGLLGSLHHERMDRIADAKIRERLEHAWTVREQRRGWRWQVRRLAPVLATVVLLAGLGTATMNASGDSALYAVRVTIEDAAVLLHPNLEDRNEYLASLLDQRQSEAARLEAAGNALAAGRVRQIEQDTLRRLQASLPKAPEENDNAVVQPAPTASPSETPAATPSASPSPTPSLSVTERPPTPTPTRTATPTPTPTPARTPTPAPTGSPMLVVLSGTVKNPDLTLADGACVAISPPPTAATTDCAGAKTTQGAYRLSISARLNQVVTVYAWRYDAIAKVMYKGYAVITVRGQAATVPDIKLAK